MPKFEGLVEEVVFRNEGNGFTVISLKQERGARIAAVGVMPFISAGERVILDGEKTEHRDYGEQIKVTSYEAVRPSTKNGIERYLGSGIIRGIGPATAQLIVNHFGVETLNILDSEPDRLTEVAGIGTKRAQMIIDSYQEQHDARQTMIMLTGFGLSATLSAKVYKLFGNMAGDVVRGDPYRLVDEVPGVGFRTADQIAHAIGIEAENEHRIQCGIKYALNEACTVAGHMFLPMTLLMARAQEVLGVDEELIDTAMRSLLVRRELVPATMEENTVVYLPKLYEAEADVARLLRVLASTADQTQTSAEDAEAGISAYERDTEVSLCAEQRTAVLTAVTGGLTVITGGPGTGKTTSINCIIRLMSDYGKVELCAPTGRAAKRMSEATGKNARTIHRLLEYGGEDNYFQRNEDNPLDAKVIIVDEMSMVDIFLMRSLLKAIRPGARVVFVGDADQLPSVGAGNVLKDVIDAGVVPVVHLTEIFRQARESMIVVNAHRINHGEYPIVNQKDSDFFLERRDSAQAAGSTVIDLVRERLPQYKGFDAMRDIQVMAPMKKGDAGVYAMNRLLQEALNPRARGKAELMRGDTLFRTGDKVMQMRNNYDMFWRRGKEEGDGVFNGDIGFVTEIDREERIVQVTFDDGRCADYDETDIDDLELAYCMSVHKSQGSEFEVVVMPLVTGARMLMTRNLLYTAVTRAKRLVVIVGREGCLRQMVDNNHIARRFSALNERIRSAFGC